MPPPPQSKLFNRNLDDRGIALPTVIITAVLALAASASGVVIYNVVRSQGNRIATNAEAVKTISASGRTDIQNLINGGVTPQNPQPAPQPVITKTYFTSQQYNGSDRRGTASQGNFAKVVNGGTTSYYFWNGLFDVWVLVESRNTHVYPTMISRAGVGANHITKPTGAPDPPETPPTFTSGTTSYFSRFLNDYAYLHAANGTASHSHYLENTRGSSWIHLTRDTPNRADFGLVATTTATLRRNGAALPALPANLR